MNNADKSNQYKTFEVITMALMRRRPRRQLSSLQDEVNRLFEDFFDTPEGSDKAQSAVWAPRVDISETESDRVISMDLPGMDRDDVNVTLEDGVLKVSGERKQEKREEEGDYQRVERAFGRFFRSFNVGPEVDPSEVEATHENGVLTIRLPKSEREQPKQIEIK